MSSFKKRLFCTSALIPLLGLGLYLYSNTSAATDIDNVPQDCFAEFIFTKALAVPDSRTRETIKINRKHIYCGELPPPQEVPVGFHARPADKFPASASAAPIPQVGEYDKNDIYTLKNIGIKRSKVSDFYIYNTKTPKNSSMFPDSCNEDQINTSILYAYGPNARNRGPSGPDSVDPDYCYAQGRPFTIEIVTAMKQTSKSSKTAELVINSAYPK